MKSMEKTATRWFMLTGTAFWITFNVIVLALLALDLLLHRSGREVSMKQALGWTSFYITLALLFGVAVYWDRGSEDAFKFLAAYLIEYSLSVDNLFVFLLLFHYFALPKHLQHDVLFWGILGTIVMRAIFIFVGLALVSAMHSLLYLFGVFLIITGIRFAFEKDKKIEPNKNPVLLLLQRYIPVTPTYHGGKFIVRQGGRIMITPLLVTLIYVEMTDIVFAIDSIPAVMAITLDPVLVYTSNIFAILGLRSLFFALSGLMGLFHYLHYGLAAILVLIGVKMLINPFWAVPIGLTLGTIATILTVSVALSLIFKKKNSTGAHHQ